MEYANQPARNRKRHRAAASNGSAAREEPVPSSTSSTTTTNTSPKIKLAHPDRSVPRNKKTLVHQLVETLGHNLDEEITAPRIYEIGSEDESTARSGSASGSDNDNDNDEKGIANSKTAQTEPVSLPPLIESIFYALCFSMLHFTLDVLVYSQYRQSVEWKPIIFRTIKALPLLTIIVYAFHAEHGTISEARFGVVRQAMFLVTAVAAGCYIVHSVHNAGYFAVMKQAPPIGTLWIWSVVEMRVSWAMASLGGVGAYMWWFGYTFY